MQPKTLRPYQLVAASRAATGHLLIADDPGLGKTLEAIMGVRMMLKPDNAHILVICPKPLKNQWIAEIGEPEGTLRYDVPYPFPDWFLADGGWCVAHYNILPKSLPFLGKRRWDAVIVDEAHRIGNRQNKWREVIKKIKATRRIALTGTPQERSAADMWGILNWLYPGFFSSYWRFYNEFVEAEPVWGTPYQRIVGTKNATQLAELLKPVMIQRRKQDVLPDLPPNLVQYVPLEMLPAQRELYKTISKADDIVVPVADELLLITNTLTKIVRLQQLSVLPSLLLPDSKLVSAKIEWVLDWLKDNPTRPVVVFTKFRGVVEYFAKQLGDTCDTLLGGQEGPPAERFRQGTVNVLVGTIASTSEGLNLQRADYAIFVDCEWSSRLMDQAINRIHRMDIVDPKHTYFLYHKDSVEDKLVLPALDRKWDDKALVAEALRLKEL